MSINRRTPGDSANPQRKREAEAASTQRSTGEPAGNTNAHETAPTTDTTKNADVSSEQLQPNGEDEKTLTFSNKKVSGKAETAVDKQNEPGVESTPITTDKVSEQQERQQDAAEAAKPMEASGHSALPGKAEKSDPAKTPDDASSDNSQQNEPGQIIVPGALEGQASDSPAESDASAEQQGEADPATQKITTAKRKKQEQATPGQEPVDAPKPVNAAEKKGMPAQPVTPAPRPRAEHVVTPRQEEAANRLERKRKRPRQGTDITPVIRSGGGQEQGAPAPRVSQRAEPMPQPSVSQNTQSNVPDAALAQAGRLPVTPQPGTFVASSSEAVRRDQELLRSQRQRKLVLRHISRKHMRSTRVTKQRSVNRVWLAVFTILLTFMAIVLSLSGAGSYAAYRLYSDTQNEYTPQILNLHDLLPKDNLKIYDAKGVFLAQLTDNGVHTTVPLNQISKNIVNAEVSTEDKNFWTNPGIDVARMFQAALDDVRYGHVVAGGSTITQQLIKNLVVGNETSLQRKLQEVMLTPMINDRYSKSDIMEMYLNTVYYGEQAYGVDAATNIYYGIADQPGKPAAEQLDLAQSAMLAGIVSSPSANDPLLHPQVAYGRFDFVINRMVTNGYITGAQAMDAAKEVHSPHFFKAPVNMGNRAPHFVNFVLGQLEQVFHLTRQQLSRSDMSVYTTLDIGLQDKIQKIAQQHIAELNANNVTNAAEVLIDYHTGAIRSLLGSLDYNNKSIDGQFDVATQGYRQPGSSFKPYVYVTAFEQGASPAQAIDDSSLTIQLPGGDPPTFSPKNYDLRYHGQMTLRCALQNSLNIPAVKVLQHVGIPAAMKTAQDMGIQSYDGTPGYSLVLGGLGVHLLDHTSAIGTFANGGVHVPYYAIQKVTFSTTHQSYEHPLDSGTRVISPQLAYMMTSVLSDNTDRLPEFFDCNPLQLYSNSQTACYEGDRGTVRPAAAKTGTTNDFKDNWTLGYTTDYVMGVWAGNDNDTPMYNVSGVQGAAPIWHDSMLLAEQGHPINDFVNPGGLEHATVTYPDGVHTTDWFLPGTVPDFGANPTNTNANGDNGNNGGQGLISMNPLGKHPSKNNGNNGDNGNNGNGNTSSGVGGGAPYCPGSFSFTAPSGGSKQSVW